MKQTKSILFTGGILALFLNSLATQKPAIAHAPEYHIREEEEASDVEHQNGGSASESMKMMEGDAPNPNPTQSSEVLSFVETRPEIDPFQGLSESLFLLILASPFVLNFFKNKIHS
ncbi:MAG: hypothetical protein ACP5D7_06330 [Limnospira sp.]